MIINVKRFYFLLIISICLLCQSQVAFCEDQVVADSLLSQMKYRKTAEDSLKLYYDVYDASELSYKLPIGMKILDLARRTNNQEALLDFIPQVTSVGVSDTAVITEMMRYADLLSDPLHRKTVKVFIKVKKATEEASYIPESDLSDALIKYARERSQAGKGSFYDDMAALWKVLIFLGNRNQGNLYLEYLTRLEEMMDQVPSECVYLLNQFYTTAANVHTRNGNPAKAIEMDHKLLEVISTLEKRYKDMGRTYRDYTRHYYVCYRRMLSNYKALSLDEIKELYAKCAILAEKNVDVARDFYEKGTPTIYRLMAEQDYEAAVPKIKQALKTERSKSIRGRLLRMLVTAADSIHDEATLLTALRDYSKYLKTTLDAQSEEAYQELQTRYDIRQLQAERDSLESEKRDIEIATSQRVITVALIGLLVLAIVLMFIYRSNFSLKRRVRNTLEENVQLHHTIEDMLGNTGLKGTLDVRQNKSEKNEKSKEKDA